MRSTSISRPTPSMIVAIVALVMALGGTSYAAATLSGKSIKKRSVPADRIVNNALTGSQINEQRLGIVPMANVAKFADTAKNASSAQTAGSAQTAKNADLADNAKSAETAKLADKATLADTATNAQALQGRGPEKFMANQVRVVVAVSPSIADGLSANVVASCNADEKAIGGGAAWTFAAGNPTIGDARLSASMPEPGTEGTDTMTGWRGIGRNEAGSARVLRAYATCVPKTA